MNAGFQDKEPQAAEEKLLMDLWKSRHSRARGNPEIAKLIKKLDSRFHGNDENFLMVLGEIGNFKILIFCENLRPRFLIRFMRQTCLR